MFNPNSIANLLCLVLWREEYASHSLPVSPFAHQILGKPPSEIKLTLLYFPDLKKNCWKGQPNYLAQGQSPKGKKVL